MRHLFKFLAWTTVLSSHTHTSPFFFYCYSLGATIGAIKEVKKEPPKKTAAVHSKLAEKKNDQGNKEEEDEIYRMTESL